MSKVKFIHEDCDIALSKDTTLPNNAYLVTYVESGKTKYVKNLPWYKNDHRYLPLIVIYRGASKISEVFVRHRERIFGQTNYPKIRKIIFGFFEVLFFILRLRIGVYKKVK